MKWFLISLAIALSASDKLDRTYLPPPGAQFAGGVLGSHDAPLEPPHHTLSGQGPVIGGQGAQPNFEINEEPVNFGDKIPKVPVTTTSYAFSQTTTYPPGESFETTAFPINPVTGLPIGLEQGNFPFGSTPGQATNFGTNIEPGFVPQGPTSVPVSTGSSGYDQFANQPLIPYPGQNVIAPGGASQTPGSVYGGQNQGQLQYPNGQVNTEQQGFLPTGAPGNQQRLDQYPGQSIVNPGGVVPIPGVNQGLVQYPGSQTVVNLQPAGNQQGVSYDGSQGPVPQGTYTGQPINVQNLGGTQPTQTSYHNQEPAKSGGIPSQYPNGNQNYGPFVPTASENVYQPGSTPSTNPSSYNNVVSSTIPYPRLSSSTSVYSSVGPVYRSERPQAAADRNAVILNYENIRTPNGYSYSFDTSNRIHADESGIVDNGTKAQGSYSYIGDDGKVYNVIYTADENGFQPRGDHLPTPPPIPEAIQRVIEQAARDKAAGIMHDGSYDEAKYGDHQYQGTKKHRRPQNQDFNQFGNKQYNGVKDDVIKPIVEIKDEKYEEGTEKDQFKNNLPVNDTKKYFNGILPIRRPSNPKTSENNNIQDDSEENGKVSGDFDSPKGDFTGNSMPIVEEGINDLDNYGTKKQENNMPYDEAKDSSKNNQPGLKNRRPSTRRPIPGNIKDITKTKYPGFNVDVGTADYSEGDGFNNNGSQDNIGSVSPNVSNQSEENIITNFNKVKGAPIIENKQTILRQRVKGNRTPSSTGNRHTQNKNRRPQSESFNQESTETLSFSDYLKNAIANQQETKQDDNGYQYKQPNTKFEQNIFPTRFSPHEAPSTQPDQRRNEYVEGTTRKPLMSPNTYNQNDINGQSTTRISFPTIGVTSPTDNSYTDYDVNEDYATNQDIGDDRIGSTKKPANYRVTSRPYQPTQTTSRPQNVLSSHRTHVNRTHVNQKGSVTPGRKTENSGTVLPGYTYEPTTQMPSQNSRFGINETRGRMKPQQRRPSTTVPDYATAVGSPVTTQSPSETSQSDYRYQTTGPNSKYSGANVGSGYPTAVVYPGLGSMTTTPGMSTAQGYYTSTYGPSQGYSSTTALHPTSGYTQGSGSQVPFRTSGLLQPSQDQTFHTGYHYGPPNSGSLNLDGPGLFTPTGNSGVFPASPTATYQTTYQQRPGGFPSTTLGPITPGNQGTFITSQPGTFAPGTSPTGTYQVNYQNGPSTPDYATTIGSGGKPVFTYPESPAVQDTTGFEYGSLRPIYSTTDSPSSIGTTPDSFIPSGTTGPSQDYSTTRSGLHTNKDTFVGRPIDGFGTPITTEQGGAHPGFRYPTQGTTVPEINIGPNIAGTDQSITYPGSFDQTRVIGEDFSGPKKPQRYDPITGYHYK